MRLRFAATTILLLLSAAPRPACAQEPSSTLEPGDRVRVRSEVPGSGPIDGRVLRYDQERLTVAGPNGAVHSLPLESIEGLSRSLGVSRTRSAWESGRLGLFLGSGVGLVAGPLVASSDDSGPFGRTVVISGVGGAVLGTALGAGFGALFPRERWQPLQLRLSLDARDPSASSFALSVSLP